MKQNVQENVNCAWGNRFNTGIQVIKSKISHFIQHAGVQICSTSTTATAITSHFFHIFIYWIYLDVVWAISSSPWQRERKDFT